jgi:hypothetical protein
VSEPPRYYARVIGITFQPEMAERVAELYRHTSLPLVANAPGLVVVLGMLDATAGHAYSVSVWETVADREQAGITAPGAGSNLESYAAMLTGPYLRELYDVTACTLPDAEQRSRFQSARMRTVELHAPHWEAGTAALRAAIERRATLTDRGHGCMLLEDPRRLRAVVVEAIGPGEAFDATVRQVIHDLWRGGMLTRHAELRVFTVMSTT